MVKGFRNMARELKGDVHSHKITAMKHHLQLYTRLKRQSMQFMLNGDVERYMRALRIMSRLAMG
jgi:hypothetical protein